MLFVAENSRKRFWTASICGEELLYKDSLNSAWRKGSWRLGIELSYRGKGFWKGMLEARHRA
jgi:hypothetical protein